MLTQYVLILSLLLCIAKITDNPLIACKCVFLFLANYFFSFMLFHGHSHYYSCIYMYLQ